MLEELTNNDWLAVPFNFSMSNSMPTMNINKSNPIWLNCCNVPIDSFGKTKPKVVGNSAPTSEGPSTMPAIISPITAGWFMALNKKPNNFTVLKIMSN